MGVIIGTGPHKRSATTGVIDVRAKVLMAGRYGTDTVGHAEMLAAARKFAGRVWAVEGCNGIGRHLAHRGQLVGEEERRFRLGGHHQVLVLAGVREGCGAAGPPSTRTRRTSRHRPGNVSRALPRDMKTSDG